MSGKHQTALEACENFLRERKDLCETQRLLQVPSKVNPFLTQRLAVLFCEHQICNKNCGN